MKNDNILIVDDSQFMRNLLGNTIKELGYQNLFFAEDGNQAVEMVKEVKPRLVTLDISMPGMDGIDTVARLMEVSPKMKIIMISALGSSEIVKQALINGAVDFIKKPVDKIELGEMLKKHL